jgi:hypothetical protein
MQLTSKVSIEVHPAPVFPPVPVGDVIFLDELAFGVLFFGIRARGKRFHEPIGVHHLYYNISEILFGIISEITSKLIDT